MISLPEIARWIIPSDGDNHAFTVPVRDEGEAVVDTAPLTFAVLRLDSGPEAGRGPIGWRPCRSPAIGLEQDPPAGVAPLSPPRGGARKHARAPP